MAFQDQLAMQVAKKLSIPFDEVDTHNVVPVWDTSEKRETGARTIRSKIHKKLPEYLTVTSPPVVVYKPQFLSPLCGLHSLSCPAFMSTSRIHLPDCHILMISLSCPCKA